MKNIYHNIINPEYTRHGIALFLLLTITTADAQKNIGEVIESYADPSYITIGSGIDLSDNDNFDDIIYEAQLGANFNWADSGLNLTYDENIQPKDDIWGIYVPITFAVRQFSSDSSPVKTPTYNPGIRIIYANRNAIQSNEKFRFWSLGFHHYSNGQSGEHLNPSSDEVNTETGSFSSDYLELAYHILDRDRVFHFLKFKYRGYLTNLTWEEEQTDFYEKALAEVTAQFNFKRAFENTFVEALVENTIFSELFLTAGYKLGKKFDIDRDDASTKDKVQLKLEYIARPQSWNDLALYLRWDYGNDYYNINYRNRINRIQFGFIGKLF